MNSKRIFIIGYQDASVNKVYLKLRASMHVNEFYRMQLLIYIILWFIKLH